MGYRRNQFVWLVAACAALAAQAAPQTFCRGCDRPCCGSAAAVLPGAPASGGCPLCAAAADRCPTEAANPPCRCQLDARQDEPMASSRGPALSIDQVAHAFPSAATLSATAQGLGVSREYLAASLAVPIRPPRILFGVWLD